MLDHVAGTDQSCELVNNIDQGYYWPCYEAIQVCLFAHWVTQVCAE